MTATVAHDTATGELVSPLTAVELAGTRTALAIAPPAPAATFDSFRFALEPASFTDAYKMAAIVAKSGLYGVKSPEDALVRIMTGRSLGLPTNVSLQHVYEVYGRPSLSARLKMTLTLRHPECEKFEHVESDDKRAIYVIKRRGQDERRFTFTIEDAQRAQLVKDDSGWKKWPRRMLQARASSEASDVIFPEACMGMPTVEESIDAGPAESTPVATSKPVQQAAQTRDFDAEAVALKAKITAAQTKDEKRAVRAEVGTFANEAGEPWATEAKTFYNLVHGKGGETISGQQPLGGQ